MVVRKISHRLMAMVLSILFLFTIFPSVYATVEQYPAYEFVVSGDKTSLEKDETLILIVSANGPMNNASAMELHIEYPSADFSVGNTPRTAFESNWYSYVAGNKGFGYISRPSCGITPSSEDSSKNVIKIMYSSSDGFYVDEYSDIYNAETTVVAKVVFKALKDIDDASSLINLIIANHVYANDSGTVAELKNEDTTKIQFSHTAAVDKAIALIDEIGTSVTYSSKAKIEAARNAYDAVLEKLKGNVSNYATLTTAETSLGLIQAEINDVADKIKAIGEVTLEDETAIATARTAYTTLAEKDSAAANALKEYGTDSVNYIKILETAEAELANLKLVAADKVEAQKVIDKIKPLDKTITLEDEAAIDNAREAFDALTDTQKGYVNNLAVLEAAESQLATLNSYKTAAEELNKEIANIPQGDNINRDNVDTVQAQINSATIAYDAIGGGLQSLVTNWDLVALAQTRVKELNDNIELSEAFYKKVDEICSKVDLDSGDAIDRALTEYKGFNDEIKTFVAESKAKLDEAKTRYDNMVNAKTLIDALPEVDLGAEPPINEVTPACKEALEAAEEAYDALSEDDQKTIDKDNFSKLDAVRKAYDKSVADVKTATDAIDAAVATDITLESKDKIIAAKTAYGSLTAAEKKYLETYNGQDYGTVLNNAYETYVGLVEDKEEADSLQAGLVMAKIDALNNITLQSGESITDAESAYTALTDDQKTIVKSTMYGDSDKNYYDRLEEIREIYNELVADNNAVQAVITEINKIGIVNYSDDCLKAIEEAESAYDALAEADKASGKNLASQVTNYSALTTAREDYGILENIVTLINAIGNAENTDEHLSRLNAAQDAYDALDDEKEYLKKQLGQEEKKLDDAWYEYNLLLVKYVQLDITMSDGVTKKNLVVFTDMPNGQMIDLDGYNVSVMNVGEAVYNTIVTDNKLSEETLSAVELVISNSAAEPYILGDVDNSAGITGNDALIANKYAARDNEALDIFANDEMAFARADVNRSGTVTALDAFIIAKVGAGISTIDDPFAGYFENK